jgi:hypothetical protein
MATDNFNPLTELDNNKRYKATAQNVFGDVVEVVSTANCPDSSYGFQHWVSKDGESFGQITLINPFYSVSSISEITEEEAEAFFEE